MDEQEWLNCPDPGLMLSNHYLRSERKLRLFACACCRRIERYLTDAHSQNAIRTAELFADGSASKMELGKARTSAEKAPWNGWWSREERSQLNAAWQTCRGNAGNAAHEAARIAAVTTAWHEASELLDHEKWQRKLFDERNAQASLLREFVGNPFRPVAIDPAWLNWRDGTIPQFAQTIYDERRFADLQVLADALEEAGCTDADILQHCRQPGEHVRGCWVVDLLLGKV